MAGAWAINHFLRVALKQTAGGRLDYLSNLFNPFDPKSRLFAELCIVAALSYAAHRVQRPGWWPAVATTAFFFSLYLASYIHFLMLRSSLGARSVQQLPELIHVLPGLPAFLLIAFAVSLALALASTVSYSTLPRGILPGAAVASAGVFALAYPSQTIKLMDAANPLKPWHQEAAFKPYGTLFTAIRKELDFRRIEAELRAMRSSRARWPFPDPELAFSAIKQDRNVHIILLESHLDPKDLLDARYNRDPWHPDYREWRDEAPSLAVSGVFGGATANVEFEVLCGVPAYRALGPIPFNYLGGQPVPCLPELFRRRGYLTVSSSPDVASFFNRVTAYRSIGFEQTHFRDAFDMSDLDGWILSNESTFRQSFGFVREEIESGRPVFSYVASIAGHKPFSLNEGKRPRVIQFPQQSETSNRVINHSYYTSIAVAEHMQKLRAKDPEAVVIFFSDHAPFMPDADYKRANYMGIGSEETELALRLVPILIFDRGKPVAIEGAVSHYLVPEIVIDLLSDREFCRTHPCLHKRPQGLRPPFVFDREPPKQYSCAALDSEDPLCASAAKLNDELLESFFSFLKLSRAALARGRIALSREAH